MITIINLTHTFEELKPIINWSELPEDAKTFLKSYDQFRFYNSQEMLVMEDRQIIASCSISEYCGIVHIENIWTKEGKVF